MELLEARAMAEALLREHGLDGWEVEIGRAKRRAGVCRQERRVIGISGPVTLLHDAREVRDTVLHEIAHALVGAEHGHDGVWRAEARRIGCTGSRCVAPDAPKVVGAWVGTCPAGHLTQRHRRPDRPVSCGRCSTRFAPDHLLAWTHHGREVPMSAGYTAELAGLRSGAVVRVLPVGSQVRIVARGRFHGRRGRVVRLGRTSYRVRVAEGDIRVPFVLATPV